MFTMQHIANEIMGYNAMWKFHIMTGYILKSFKHMLFYSVK